MARRATILFIRFLCSLALIVALVPVKAGVLPCASPTPPTAVSSMTCCAKSAMAVSMACCRKSTLLNAVSADKGCACEIQSAPPAVLAETTAALVAVGPALLNESAVTCVVPAVTVEVEPGLYGIDSGPPREPDRRSDPGRAPPVARV